MNDYPTFNSDMIHSLLIKRKFDSEICIPTQYDQKDVEELEEFCLKHGIFGVNFGKMNPKSILSMLKSKMGIRDCVTENKKILLKG